MIIIVQSKRSSVPLSLLVSLPIYFFFFHFAPRVGGNGIQHCLWLTKYPLEISASNSQNISHFEPWGELRKDSKLPKYIYYKVVKFFV